jgi:hypothetical protein
VDNFVEKGIEKGMKLARRCRYVRKWKCVSCGTIGVGFQLLERGYESLESMEKMAAARGVME